MANPNYSEARTVSIERITEGTAKGQYRGKIDGQTVCVCSTKRVTAANVDYLLRRMPPAMLAALVANPHPLHT